MGSLVLSVFLLVPNVLPAQSDFNQDILEVLERAENLLLNREYEQLNEFFEKARDERTRSLSGALHLTNSYEHLGSPRSGSTNARIAITDRQQLLEAWNQASPSVASHIALTDCLWSLARKYRGGGLAGTITLEGSMGMQQALEAAEEAIQDAARLAEKENVQDPCIALYLMRIGHYMGRDRETMQGYLKQGYEIDPWFVTSISTMANYLLPRWYGEEGDLLEFASEWGDETQTQIGDVAYAIVAMSAFDFNEETEFREGGFEWQRAKSGLLRWLEEAPDSPSRLGTIARFAHIARDRPVAREMIERLEGRWDTDLWTYELSFERTARWAFDIDDPGESLRVVELGPQSYGGVGVISDGNSFVPNMVSGWPSQLTSYNIETGAKELEAPLWPRFLGLVSDQSIGDKTVLSLYSQGKSTILLGDLKNNNFLRSNAVSVIGQTASYAKSLVTAFNGSAIAMADRKGNVKFWQISDTPLPYQWDEIMEPETKALAISPDGSRLLVGTSRTFQVWDTLSREKLHTSESVSPKVYCAAWSPDGKTMAGAGAGGDIVLWHTDDYRELGRIDTSAEFITSIAFSPDSQHLIAGTFSRRVPAPPGIVFVCKVSDQSIPHVLSGHRLNVLGVGFTPDGSKILSASDDGSVRIWNMPAE